MAANHGADQLFLKYAVEHPLTPGRGSLVGRTALERKTVHMPDCLADPEYVALEYQSVGHYRSNLGVPLLREGVPIGVIILMRAVVMPFTDRQIELVTTFADQAVIAIENVSLFDEVQAKTRDLTESLQQQTATADVLKVISSSPGELAARVSEDAGERDARLRCKFRNDATMRRRHVSASRCLQCSAAFAAASRRSRYTFIIHRSRPCERSLRKQVVHIHDVTKESGLPRWRPQCGPTRRTGRRAHGRHRADAARKTK